MARCVTYSASFNEEEKGKEDEIERKQDLKRCKGNRVLQTKYQEKKCDRRNETKIAWKYN